MQRIRRVEDHDENVVMLVDLFQDHPISSSRNARSISNRGRPLRKDSCFKTSVFCLVGMLGVMVVGVFFHTNRAEGMVLISEILADPPDGLAGDANQDGVRSSSGDEFIELFNLGPDTTDLNGWSLWDAVSKRHVFESELLLEPGRSVVIFGAAAPYASSETIWLEASEGGLSLNNSGDSVRLFDATGVLVDRHDYGSEGGRNVSLARDFREASYPWVLHSDLVLDQPYSTESMPFSDSALAVNQTSSPHDSGLNTGESLSNDDPSMSMAAVPEPAGLGLFALGLAMFWLLIESRFNRLNQSKGRSPQNALLSKINHSVQSTSTKGIAR